jgi:hypothetical protein
MDKKTYAFIPLVATLVLSLFFGIQPESTHRCEITMTERYCFDVSSGAHTRCYIDNTKKTWDTCSSGWIPKAEWVKTLIEENNAKRVLCYPKPRGCEVEK